MRDEPIAAPISRRWKRATPKLMVNNGVNVYSLHAIHPSSSSRSTPPKKYCIVNLVLVASFNVSSWLRFVPISFFSFFSRLVCVSESMSVSCFSIFLKITIRPIISHISKVPNDVIHCVSILVCKTHESKHSYFTIRTNELTQNH